MYTGLRRGRPIPVSKSGPDAASFRPPPGLTLFAAQPDVVRPGHRARYLRSVAYFLRRVIAVSSGRDARGVTEHRLLDPGAEPVSRGDLDEKAATIRMGIRRRGGFPS